MWIIDDLQKHTFSENIVGTDLDADVNIETPEELALILDEKKARIAVKIEGETEELAKLREEILDGQLEHLGTLYTGVIDLLNCNVSTICRTSVSQGL